MDAALAQLDDGGPTAVNWRALARAVGVSPSTLYTYFESLDALYTALMAPLLAAVAAMLGRTDTDVEAWTPEQRARTVGAWSQLHGFVSLEVNHHLVWIDDLDAVFASMIEGMLAGVATE